MLYLYFNVLSFNLQNKFSIIETALKQNLLYITGDFEDRAKSNTNEYSRYIQHEQSNEIKKYRASHWYFQTWYKNKYVYRNSRKFHHNRIIENYKRITFWCTQIYSAFFRSVTLTVVLIFFFGVLYYTGSKRFKRFLKPFYAQFIVSLSILKNVNFSLNVYFYK